MKTHSLKRFQSVSHPKPIYGAFSYYIAYFFPPNFIHTHLPFRSPTMSIVRRVAIVSGAAKGIGRAVALRLARDGLDVAVNDLPAAREGLNVVADEIRQHGRKSWAVCADVSTEEGVRTVVSQSVEKLGGLDVVSAAALSYRSAH